jgi:hypothetical protein
MRVANRGRMKKKNMKEDWGRERKSRERGGGDTIIWNFSISFPSFL